MTSTEYELIEITELPAMLTHLPLLQQLNRWLTAAELEQMLMEMIPNGYKMVVVKKQGKVLGLSGYWINTMIWCGRYIEMDNVVVDKDHRSEGIGKMLLDWVIQKGKEEGCKSVALDAYVENPGAHRFYFREGFRIRGFHFTRDI